MRRVAAICALALAALFALAPLAAAEYDPVGSGATKLALDKGFLTLLKRSGVKLAAITPARLRGGVVTFPAAGGKFDPTSARGVVEHEGGLAFTAEGRSVRLRALQLKTSRRSSPFSVKVGGGQLKLATAAGLAVTRESFGDTVRVRDLSLSAKVATRLGKKLRLRGVFEAGQPLGSARTGIQPQTIALLGKGKASLVLAPGIAAKLDSLFVAVNPIFPAERPGAEFTFPLFGGAIAPDASLGTLETSGSLELLQLGGGQVFWREPHVDLAAKSVSAEIDVQPSPPYPGKIGRGEIAGLSGARVSSSPKARTITVEGASLSLGAQAAATFNEVFAKPQGKDGVFAAGEPLGSLSFTAQGQ